LRRERKGKEKGRGEKGGKVRGGTREGRGKGREREERAGKGRGEKVPPLFGPK